MNMFDKFFKKESPVLGVLGLGGGIARRAAAGGLGASGGTVTTHNGIYSSHIYIHWKPSTVYS